MPATFLWISVSNKFLRSEALNQLSQSTLTKSIKSKALERKDFSFQVKTLCMRVKQMHKPSYLIELQEWLETRNIYNFSVFEIIK